MSRIFMNIIAFFENHSGELLQDDELSHLLTFPKVLITAHQAFLTQ